ncbi:unnamed protein product [Ceutorhynchus assimilis]|uniref:Uncharacterized protein n=1 Tax=Ceutorhynchus assimilis TaxID=467358 RepID=A0A9N9MK65_9CUCU|nr:unnamed protein product [Ceutorhynchus assimilis]
MKLSILIVALCLTTIECPQPLQDIKAGLNLLRHEPNSDSEAGTSFDYIKKVLLRFLSTLKRDKRTTAQTKKSQWRKWTDWSPCSVTCGKGRSIRWRHCKARCQNLETEMEEVACQLPECPKKLFGLIKLL